MHGPSGTSYASSHVPSGCRNILGNCRTGESEADEILGWDADSGGGIFSCFYPPLFWGFRSGFVGYRLNLVRSNRAAKL